jgi:hypothetical protein
MLLAVLAWPGAAAAQPTSPAPAPIGSPTVLVIRSAAGVAQFQHGQFGSIDACNTAGRAYILANSGTAYACVPPAAALLNGLPSQ